MTTEEDRAERLTMGAEEAAQELGVCVKTLYQLAQRQDFPVVRGMRRLRINREGLRRWVNHHTNGMEEEP